ncbi:MAG: DUF72 domain-containing protein [Thermoleophilia bacterium]|nr:DUF72 domain-containing protein [Thermoleophilia bacterium]
MSAVVRVGTCSWADELLTRYWYPPSERSAEGRLRYYAERYDTVEANSTYYRLPAVEMVARWAERTPPGFVMHVKAFALMTRHPVKPEALPTDLRAELPVDDRGRVDRMPRPLRGEVFRVFGEALEPLRAAGKLGGILLQFPPYFVFRERSLEYLEWAKEALRGDEMLVEFRHASWLDEDNRTETLRFLEERGMTYVCVDAPRTGARNVLPTVIAATTPTAYVRFHGRNAKTWNVRGGSAAERFDYLYPREELEEWAEPLRELAGAAENAYAMFNTNNRSTAPSPLGDEQVVVQGPANAETLRAVLADAGVPVTQPAVAPSGA